MSPLEYCLKQWPRHFRRWMGFHAHTRKKKKCFVDKNKYIKKDVAVEFETLCSSVDKNISPDDQENFHEFLRSAIQTHLLRTYIGLKAALTIC